MSVPIWCFRVLRLSSLGVLFWLSLFPVFAKTWTIRDIHLTGLHYLSEAQVFPILPIKPGDEVDKKELNEALLTLSKTGLFFNVAFYRKNNNLILVVKERPVIGKISFKGNKAMPKESLQKILKENSLSEGSIFQKGALERIGTLLTKIYESAGQYGTSIQYKVNQKEDAVDIEISIQELSAASIESIRLVGNQTFQDSKIKKLMNLKEPKEALWGSSGSLYTPEQMEGDATSISRFYRSKGFLNFEITNAAASVSKDRKRLFVTLSMDEGRRYHISKNTLNGKTIINENEAKEILFFKKGSLYNQIEIEKRSKNLEDLLKNLGYLDAKVDVTPKADKATAEASLNFSVTPGVRKYVRRILIRGNKYTADEVLRREVRQQEGAMASKHLIDLSKARIERLGQYKNIQANIRPVSGSPDAVDIVFLVEEDPKTQVSFTFQYSVVSKLGLGASFSQKNLLGSGYDFSSGINYNKSTQSLNFSLSDPYVFRSGMILQYGLSYSKLDTSSLNIQNYAMDQYSASVGLSYPVGESSMISYSLAYNERRLTLGSTPTNTTQAFVSSQGKIYKDLPFRVFYNFSNLDNGYLPTQGVYSGLGYTFTLPNSKNKYHNITYNYERYDSLNQAHTWVLRNNMKISYGQPYGNSKFYPFYENKSLGGVYNLRGFSSGLGPKSYYSNGLESGSLGGNGLATYRGEIFLPIPQKNIRAGFFIDAATLYNNHCIVKNNACNNHFNFNESIRASVGVRLTWYTPFSPISMSYGIPLKKQKDDTLDAFQFSLGYAY